MQAKRTVEGACHAFRQPASVYFACEPLLTGSKPNGETMPHVDRLIRRGDIAWDS